MRRGVTGGDKERPGIPYSILHSGLPDKHVFACLAGGSCRVARSWKIPSKRGSGRIVDPNESVSRETPLL